MHRPSVRGPPSSQRAADIIWYTLELDSDKDNAMSQSPATATVTMSNSSGVKVAFLLLIIINAFFRVVGNLSTSLALTTRSHVFAEAFSPSPLPSMTSTHYVELGKVNRHSTMSTLGSMPKISIGLRRRRRQLLSLQPLVRKGHPSTSRNAVRIAPILIASMCIFAFQQQPALAISLSNIFTASSSSILGSTIASTAATTSAPPSYHLTRTLFLRLLAIVYTTAFSIAKFQNNGLIGDHGILPARHILNECDLRAMDKSQRRNEWLIERQNYSSTLTTRRGNITNLFTRWKNNLIGGPIDIFLHDKFLHRTDKTDRPLLTLLWLAPNRHKLNPWLTNLANVGLFLSSIILCTGSANVFVLLGLWSIQRSFMAVGGEFYGYGWEMQLTELTFLSMFMVPLLSLNPFFGPSSGVVFPVPTLAIWAIRWYLFKIMLGAGLIKFKSSDMKWKLGNMSTMDYFYETQPVPNPFSRYFHFNPKWWHRFEVYSNHFVELVAPFLLLMPSRKLRQVGGIIQIMFQWILISSGNLSFLNWLTIVPAIFCFDDVFLMNALPSIAQNIVFFGTRATQSYISGNINSVPAPMLRNFVSIAFFALVVKLNINVVRNLLAQRQIMNGSFDKLRLCGTYGAFGVVAEQREELIIESASDIKGPWKEYHFKVKPGDVHRSPKWISPYHHRLDWQMWIASQSGRVERSPWLMSLLLKLLRQEKDVIDLIEYDPWESLEDASPKYIRIEKYLYKFDNHRNSPNGGTAKPPYWVRHRVGRFFPKQGVMTTEMLEDLVNGR